MGFLLRIERSATYTSFANAQLTCPTFHSRGVRFTRAACPVPRATCSVPRVTSSVPRVTSSSSSTTFCEGSMTSRQDSEGALAAHDDVYNQIPQEHLMSSFSLGKISYRQAGTTHRKKFNTPALKHQMVPDQQFFNNNFYNELLEQQNY